MTGHPANDKGADPALARLAGGLRLLHPFPSLMNMMATLLFATLARSAPPGIRTTTLLAGAIFASQAAIGIANDWADRDLDRATKPGKPLAAGLMAPWGALVMLGAALAIAMFCAVQFGLASLLLVAAGTGLGLAYDFWLKRTSYSWLPYLLAIPLEPIWVWTALGRFTPRLLWLYPLGATLLLALHLANALADFSGDTAAGAGGLVQRLGRRRATRLLWVAALLPALLASLLGLALPLRWSRWLPAVALSLLPLLAAVWLVRRRPGQNAVYRTVFGLLIISTIVLATGWLGAAL
ncbi:MAG TPA: UbiA family prenyltransferase [Thermomicrobiales bacterium]|nr:UbiA family prenyltransferase [Thermomicrobiales bacterium]